MNRKNTTATLLIALFMISIFTVAIANAEVYGPEVTVPFDFIAVDNRPVFPDGSVSFDGTNLIIEFTATGQNAKPEETNKYTAIFFDTNLADKDLSTVGGFDMPWDSGSYVLVYNWFNAYYSQPASLSWRQSYNDPEDGFENPWGSPVPSPTTIFFGNVDWPEGLSFESVLDGVNIKWTATVPISLLGVEPGDTFGMLVAARDENTDYGTTNAEKLSLNSWPAMSYGFNPGYDLRNYALVTIPIPPPPAEVWVDDDYTPGNPGWETTHWDEIQEGVDAVAEGGTVYVAGGEYYTASIHKSLTLLGAQADIPIVDGERAGEESIIRGKTKSWPPYKPTTYCLVRIQHSDVVINGFTIVGAKQWNIGIQGSSIRKEGISNILVSYNYIESSGKDGIFRDNAVTDVIVDHNYIASNPRGIATNGGATTITDNTFYHNGQGITFNGGDPYSVYFPDYAEPKYPTLIRGNTFTDDSTSIYLRLDKCHQSITITGNDIAEARNDAIRTWNVYDEGYVGYDGIVVTLVNPAIHYNNIVGSTNFGINNQVSEINLDATLNWWGSTHGPSRAMGKAKGHISVKGDRVSPNVLFAPWLKDAVDLE